MIRKLHLTNFKSFRDAELGLGPITTVIGTNASGKSNLRDAFRFLHGVGRGYALADIIGQKYSDAGYREWGGIRGGVREVSRFGESGFGLEVEVSMRGAAFRYRIEVETGDRSGGARVVRESLERDQFPITVSGRQGSWTQYDWRPVFDSHSSDDPVRQEDRLHLGIRFPRGGGHRKSGPRLNALSHQPAISQLATLAGISSLGTQLRDELTAIGKMLDTLKSMRFVDFSPEAMRRPSIPGQTELTDQGENLSSVLQAICGDPAKKGAMISRLEELTPMDVTDLEFVEDSQGRVQVQIVERDGGKVSANSASDGTLRFLGIVAALVGPKAAKFYFLEELDNGIHPVRMHLLFNFIERQTRATGVQVFTTTHSPQWLRFMSPKLLGDVTLAYRVEGVPETRLIALDRMDHLKEVIAKGDIARLYEGGWMEETMFYKEGRPEVVVLEEDPASADEPPGEKNS